MSECNKVSVKFYEARIDYHDTGFGEKLGSSRYEARVEIYVCNNKAKSDKKKIDNYFRQKHHRKWKMVREFSKL